MKKLMIAAAIVCAAAMSQAAAIAWQSGSVMRANAEDGTAGTLAGMNTVTMYVYELLSDPLGTEGGKTAAEKYAAAQQMDVAGLYDTFYGTTATVSAKTLPTGTAAVNQTVGDGSGNHYAVILFVDTANANLPEGKEAFVKGLVTVADVQGSGTLTMPNTIANATSSKWTAVPVPEPTSGLLLLLGVAGMALRRRRA